MSPSLAITFTERALAGVDSLPPEERADLYEFAGSTLHREGCAHLGAVCKEVAQHIREATSAQMHLTLLFRSSPRAQIQEHISQ